MQHFILSTAGHVDHGKSSLVQALTGIDPDRLPEEKARGITIDLGFAHLDLPHPEIAGEVFRVGIVDVPGHEDFVRNMVAGVGSIDLALLVVAADDGWMPQTEEHLQILLYLGVQRLVVALTKADLVGEGASRVEPSLRDALAGTPYHQAEIVGTSVATGQGLEELKSTLARNFAQLPAPRNVFKPRLPIDRAFTLRGLGTIVTGTLTGGELARNQEVLIQPDGIRGRIRRVQSHNVEIERAVPGARTALNLPEIALADRARPGVRRGQIVTLPELDATTRTADVHLTMSGRSSAAGRPGRPIRNGLTAWFHHGSGSEQVQIHLAGVKTLSPGESVLAQLRFAQPMFLLAGERFIIRDWAGQCTLAGGVILDIGAARPGLADPSQLEFLKRRAEHPADGARAVAALVERDKVLPWAGLWRDSIFGRVEIERAAGALAHAQRVGTHLVETGWWNGLRAKVGELVAAEHRRHPDSAGLPLANVRQSLPDWGAPSEIFEPLLSSLGQIEVVSGCLRMRSHRPSLPPAIALAGEKVRAALAAQELAPPSRLEVAPGEAEKQALRFLIQTGEVIELAPDAIICASGYRQARERVVLFLRQHQSGTVSQLRQAIGTNRRVAVPLLERMDKEGVTRREGDVRRLAKEIR